MRNACRKAFTAALTVLCGCPLMAQSYPNGLSMDSVDPATDTIIIRQMREKMDSIHINAHRPTVALVLSGGGAKGAAHVGVMRYLEEQQIPVDMILGTSIGSLVGGLFSLGYDSAYLQELFRAQDWSVTLTDKVPWEYIPYSTKLDKEKYLISVPFHYDDNTFNERIYEQTIYSDRRGEIRVGATDGDLSTRQGVNNLASSLPSGYVYGFNVNNLLSSLSVGYQDSISFKDLPIPFCCVAADMVSCKSKNWGSGSLKTAMRSSMSIPGLFDPVRYEGMVLVDGGTRNNFPTDIAKAMGADYIIGVDLSDSNPAYSQVNNLGNILSQFITMLGKDAFDKNVDTPDVLIKPMLDGYNMLSFNAEAIDVMLSRGYRAALEQADGLANIKAHMKGEVPHVTNRKPVDLSREKVLLGAILFDGLNDAESLMMQERIGMKVGTWVGKKDMDEAMAIIQATGAFDSVTYSMLGTDNPYRLVFHCAMAPTHQVGLGLRMDNEEYASLLFNIGLNTHELMGSKFDFTLKVGQSQYGKFRYSLDLPSIPTLNAEVDFGHYNGVMVQPSVAYDIKTSYVTHKEMLYMSNIRWTAFDFKVGLKAQGYRMPNATRMIVNSVLAHESLLHGTYLGAFADATIYTMDNRSYPTSGMDLSFNYTFDPIKIGDGSFIPVHAAQMNLRFPIPIGERFAIIPDLHVRSLLDSGDDSSLGHRNFVGGRMAGRYIEQQIPMVGFNNVFLAGDVVAVYNLDLRLRVLDNFYFSAQGGYMRSGANSTAFFGSAGNDYLGAAFEAAYNTVAGPIKANVSWSSVTQSMGWYLSFGFDF